MKKLLFFLLIFTGTLSVTYAQPYEYKFADFDNDGFVSEEEFKHVLDHYLKDPGSYSTKLIKEMLNYYRVFANSNPEIQALYNQYNELHLDTLSNRIYISNQGPNYNRQNFKHKIDEKISIGDQITGIAQYSFGLPNAKYSGPMSLSPNPETQTLTMATISMLYNPWKNTDINISPEFQLGNGIGNGAGMGTYPNALYAFPQQTPYLLRAQIKQHLFFKDNKRLKEYDITAGRFILQEMFDVNPYASDPKRDFLNFAHNMMAAWDASTTAYGYTHGIAQSLIMENSSLNLVLCSVNDAAGSPKSDIHFNEGFSVNAQFVHNYTLFGKPGRIRYLAFTNKYYGGNYSNLLLDTTTHTSLFANTNYVLKYGGAIDLNYDISDTIGVFLRASANDGKNESFGYNQCDLSINGGLLIKPHFFKRPYDTFGLCASYNEISKQHQAFLKAGGVGFMVGDGALNYKPESAIETFYSLNFFHEFYITINYQYVFNVGYNADRGSTGFLGLRLNIEL